MTGETTEAQGWYQDPFSLHEHRWFSAGEPTKLVCDSGQESYDPPPDNEPILGSLVPVEVEPSTRGSEEGLRAGGDQRNAGRSQAQAALDVIPETIPMI
jgi:hypothetical protein